MRPLAVLAACLAAMHEASAQAPRLGLPLACAPGESCWIFNHVDLDAGPGTLDYACGELTYNGHNGTDFALRDARAMAEGVRVLAAAPGTVAAVRDGEPDLSVRVRGREAVAGRQCGNGVRMRHGEGWETQYCHLRRGSIRVRPGQALAAGAALGLVGLSGETEYPHLHFTLRRGARTVDPFRGETAEAGCGPGARPLWDQATLALLPYAPGSLYNFGVAPMLPAPEAAREGALRARELAPQAAVFAVWAEALGVRPGDVLELRVERPDGSALIAHRARIERRQARVFRAVGRKRGAAPWPAGEYRVTITLARARGGEHHAGTARFTARIP